MTAEQTVEPLYAVKLQHSLNTAVVLRYVVPPLVCHVITIVKSEHLIWHHSAVLVYFELLQSLSINPSKQYTQLLKDAGQRRRGVNICWLCLLSLMCTDTINQC
jgi:hypothetical protein